jgi:dTMP kinase
LPVALAPEDQRTLDEVAKSYVTLVLEACRGNHTNAARALGIDRKTLARRLKRWRITTPTAPRDLRPGSLVAIEGLDGAGITTQAKLLVEHLNASGHKAIYTDEPSAGPIGQMIRGLLANRETLSHAGSLRALSLLFAADRIDHFHRLVAPALASETTVVSDRWYHSSLAYQRTAVEREWIMALNRHTRTPDITVLLEVSPETGQLRRKAAGRTPEFFHDLATQREVVAGYRATIAELRVDGERIEVVDGEGTPAAVFASVLRAVGAPTRSRQAS